jgi:pimeloyl-ACP methyl ester carboxylesterase
MKRGLKWGGAFLGFGLCVVLGFLLLGGLQAKRALVKKNPPPGKIAVIGGGKWHYQLLGKGPITVVMEAGQSESLLTWSKVVPGLARHTRVFIYDRAGLGWSAPGPSPRTADHILIELNQLLRHANIAPPYILVGHSMGGLYMKMFAAASPENVKGLVLIDSAHEQQFQRFPPEQMRAIEKYKSQSIGQFRLLKVMAGLGLLAMDLEKIPTDPRLPPEARIQYKTILAKDPEMFATMINEFQAQDASFKQVRDMNIKALKIPLTVIRHGKKDPIVPAKGMKPGIEDRTERDWQAMQSELAALSENSRLIIAFQSGHYIQLDEPQLVIDAILEMVNRCENDNGLY